MSVIIRLQNLPWTANALDIRRFFVGLSIPDGGVHIVGGDKGDAFIAFSTDEDARRAMLMDNGRIGTHTVKLFLSSKTEMQNVIAVARGVSTPSQNTNSQNMAMAAPSQNQFSQPNSGMGNFGPSAPQGFMQNSSGMMMQHGAPQNQMRVGMPMEQRVISQDVHFNPMQQDPMMSQNRPMERNVWDDRDMDPRDRGDYGRRDMGPTNFDMNGSGFNGVPLDVRDMNEPVPEFRGQRNDFRGPSPRRDHYSPSRDRFMDDRRDRRKRGFDDNRCIFVSNFPVPLNYRDLRAFFTGLEIPRNGLKLINDRNGQRIGEAFVQFAADGLAQQALRMDGWMVKGQRVHIEPSSIDKFEEAIDSFVPHGSNPGRNDRPAVPKRPRSRSPPKLESLAIVVKNIPFSATKKDLFRFFSGVRFAKGDISLNIEYGKEGKPAGSALIELFSERDLAIALDMHRQAAMNGRVVDVVNISQSEYASRVERSSKYAPKDEESAQNTSMNEEKIESKADKRSPSRGKAESRREDKKDDKSDKKTMADTAKKGDKMYCVKLHGLPFDCDKAAIEKFFSGLQISTKGIRIVYQPNGKAHHIGYVEFVSSDDCKKALEKDKQYIGSRYINVAGVTKHQMMEEFHAMTKKFGERYEGREGGGRGRSPSANVANQVGRPGCVVGIQNLHYQATLEDILAFFRGFEPIPETVKMRYNQEGRPTGDAMLAFHRREDAQAAVHAMNRRPLLDRDVSLSIM